MEEVTVNTVKKRRIKWGRVLILVIVLLIIILFVPFGNSSLGKKFLNGITASAVGTSTVATVDKEKISNEELEKEYSKLSPDFKSLYTKETLLKQLVADKLILNEARKQNIVVSDEEFNQILSQAQQGLPNGVMIEQIASNQGVTLVEFKAKIREQLLVKRYLDKNVIVKNVGEQDAKTFFDVNKDKLRKPEMVNASHILIKTREEADEVLKDLNNGKNFEDIAKEKSLDPGSKQNGGNLGFFGRGQMVKEFENTVFNLSVGQLSGPVETQFGFHIIRLDGKKEASDANFDEIKQQIISYLQSQENDKAIKDYVDKLINDAISSGRVKILYKENSALRTN